MKRVEVVSISDQIQVGAKIPKLWKEKIDKYVLSSEYSSISEYIRSLIRRDLKERGLIGSRKN